MVSESCRFKVGDTVVTGPDGRSRRKGIVLRTSRPFASNEELWLVLLHFKYDGEMVINADQLRFPGEPQLSWACHFRGGHCVREHASGRLGTAVEIVPTPLQVPSKVRVVFEDGEQVVLETAAFVLSPTVEAAPPPRESPRRTTWNAA
jgi:hypothetical protein